MKRSRWTGLMGSMVLSLFGCFDSGGTVASDETSSSDATSTSTSTTMGSDATSSSSTTTGTQGTTQATDDGSGTGPSTADSTGTGSAETGTTGETTATGTTGSCQPITEDASAIGDDCSDMPCPAEYTCWEISAFQLQQLCEIICEQDCECPQGHTCEMMEDKVKQWMQCNPI